ncbi:hypothetical protein [Meridianimarinicoccus aquatilis]|uniref:Uncharacterized protein n=1 Tax=Meridianimarinicoccus aquatilis TaxID=2552766 RepID=A0A4R6AWI9_9RHOB|nr:hypothetical protein [Fluviibacterium aquatile]TDL88132.1 hypothetical protein E2L05_08790 [Fluviibacterium aquatile]
MIPLVFKGIIKYEMIPVEIRRPRSFGGYLTFADLSAWKRFAFLARWLRREWAFGRVFQDGWRKSREIRCIKLQITSVGRSIGLFSTMGVYRGDMVVEGAQGVITNVVG